MRRPLAIALLLVLGGVLLATGPAVGQTFVSVTASTVPEQPTANESFAIDVTVERADGDSGHDTVESVAVYDASADGDEPIAEHDPHRTLAPGGETTVRVDDLELDRRGAHELRIVTTVLDGDVERTIETHETVHVYSSAPLVEVEAAEAVPGAWRPLNVTLANGLDSPISGVAVGVESDAVDFRVRQRVTPSVEARSSYTAAFRARPDSAGVRPVDVTVDYEDPDGTVRTVTQTARVDFTAPDNPGAVRLTGVSVEDRGGTVQVSGSAANTGGESVGSVLVGVGNASGVEPARPQPEYFVGGVDPSGFASFTVNAEVGANASEVPLTVSYSVDGVERTTTRTVSYDAGPRRSASPAPSSPSDDSNGFGALPLVGAVLVLGVVGAVVYRRR